MSDVLASATAVLAATASRWQQLAETIPAEDFTRPAAAGEWSALECLRHICDTERWVFPTRVRAFLAGQPIVAFDPETQGSAAGQSAPELAAELARMRAESLALLKELSAADLARTAEHSELGTVTLGELIHEWAAHDLNHTIQAERALMQPFIAGCGPWRSNFSDHDLARAVQQG
jgi:uncharacterized damage-inducible protein DinB